MQEKIKNVVIKRGTPGTATLLQKGVAIPAYAGMSIRKVMTEILEFSEDYAENRVRTVFLNSSPVDDIDEVRISDGDTLSLSGALPGICGIAMGRDTVISGFRSDISARGGAQGLQEGDALIYLKLFNLVAKDAGDTLLQKGVLIQASEVLKSMQENAPKELTPDDGPVFLKVVQ